MSRKSIAIVCDSVPYPLRSGDHTRISEMISVLRQKDWCVHLITTAPVDHRSVSLCRENVDFLHQYQGKTAKVQFRYAVRRAARFFDRLSVSRGLPLAEDMIARLVGKEFSLTLCDYWLRYQDGLDSYLDELDARYGFSAVIIEYIWLYRAKDKLRSDVLKILDTIDMQHLRFREFAERGEVFPLSIDRDQEARIFGQFDAVIAIQGHEARLAREMCPETTILTIGCGAIDRCCSGHDGMSVPGRLLYVGGYNTPNTDGLRYFLDYLWPRILENCPEAHLHVCGNVYRSFLSRPFDRVEFLGVVEDISAEYRKAEVVINPIWIGTGLKIKTVEAIAFGKPLVTTPKGIEGMPGYITESCCVAASKEDYADAVVAVLKDPRLLLHYAEKAEDYAACYLSSETVYGELFDFLDRFATQDH